MRSHPVASEGSLGPSLVAYVISTIISWAGSLNLSGKIHEKSRVLNENKNCIFKEVVWQNASLCHIAFWKQFLDFENSFLGRPKRTFWTIGQFIWHVRNCHRLGLNEPKHWTTELSAVCRQIFFLKFRWHTILIGFWSINFWSIKKYPLFENVLVVRPYGLFLLI